MNINLTHLKFFYDAAMYNSVSIAARENFVSQSAISQGIAKLEVALQSALMLHQRPRFRLTEEGVIVFNEAKRLFGTVEEIKDKLAALKGEVSGQIHFACTNSLAQFFLPQAYLAMKRQYPKVNIKFHRGSLKYIHEALRMEKVNFALVLEAPEFDNYNSETIYKGCFGLYKTKKIKKSTGIIIDHKENYEVQELCKRYKKTYGKDLEIIDEVSGWALVQTFVHLGHGTGFLPDFIAKGNNDLKEVKIDIAPIQYSICMIYSKGAVLTQAEKAFLEILRHT